MPSRYSHQRLLVWHKAIDLVLVTYALAAQLPADGRFVLGAQLRRAAVSIPANIAEGNGRRTRPDRRHLFEIARGSLRELQTHLVIISKLAFAPGDMIEKTDLLADEVARMLNGLIAGVR